MHVIKMARGNTAIDPSPLIADTLLRDLQQDLIEQGLQYQNPRPCFMCSVIIQMRKLARAPVLNSSIMHEDLFSSRSAVEKWSNCQSKNMFKHFVMSKRSRKKEKSERVSIQFSGHVSMSGIWLFGPFGPRMRITSLARPE